MNNCNKAQLQILNKSTSSPALHPLIISKETFWPSFASLFSSFLSSRPSSSSLSSDPSLFASLCKGQNEITELGQAGRYISKLTLIYIKGEESQRAEIKMILFFRL